MLVKDLIKKLEVLDQDLYVFIKGYESGLDFLNDIGLIHAVLDVNTHSWDGKHEEVEMSELTDQYVNNDIVKGILLK